MDADAEREFREFVAARVPLRSAELRTGDHGVSWGPGGRGFAAWLRSPQPFHADDGEMTLFDATRRPTRRYPLPARRPHGGLPTSRRANVIGQPVRVSVVGRVSVPGWS